MPFFELLATKAVFKGDLADNMVAMIIYCVTKMITCSLTIGQFFDAMIVASSAKEWL